MMNELVLKEIVTDWQSHTVKVRTPSLGQVHRTARKFQRSVRLWNAYQYAAGAVTVFAYARLLLLRPSGWGSVGSALIIAGCVFGMYRIHKERSARSVPADLGTATCLEFHRTELE